MKKHERTLYYDDIFEYHGGTSIERTRRMMGSVIRKDWILFNSVEEAEEYFYAGGDA